MGSATYTEATATTKQFSRYFIHSRSCSLGFSLSTTPRLCVAVCQTPRVSFYGLNFSSCVEDSLADAVCRLL